MASNRQRRLLALSGAVMLALTVAACGGGDSGNTSEGKLDTPECAAFADYTGIAGETVTIYSPIRDAEAGLLEQAWAKFADCTGVKIEYEGSGEFEAQLKVRVQGGDAPDLAFIPQPGLLEFFAKGGKLKAAGEKTKAMATQNFSPDWLKYGTVDGTMYGAPLGANVKSFVWYSPALFKEKGWTVPTTWDEMITLSNTMAAAGIKPWCAGIGSGEATGWPATDWLEDVLLRTAGPEVYDQWVNHEIPFNDPAVVEGLDTVGDILKNEDYVNGGFGDSRSIASTEFTDGGLPILDGECAMHRQASFYAANWPDGTDVSENGDAFAFYLPPIGEEFGSPVLGGGEFVTAFSDAIEVEAFMTYISGGEWVNEKGKATPRGGFVSANSNLDIANVASPIDKASVEILQNPDAVFRFDGSDLMPGAVGAGSFWKEMTAWIGEDQSTQESLDNIESSWP